MDLSLWYQCHADMFEVTEKPDGLVVLKRGRKVVGCTMLYYRFFLGSLLVCFFKGVGMELCDITMELWNIE